MPSVVRWRYRGNSKRRIRNFEEGRRLEFRIGVNLGDVVEEADTILGDGVNIAARLEGLSEAGGICISGTAFDQVRNKLDLGYEYLGEQNVKNIALPVRAYKVLMEPEADGKVVGEKKPRAKQWGWKAMAGVAVMLLVAGGLVWKYLERCVEDLEIIQEVDLVIPVGVDLHASCLVSGDYQRINQIAPTIIRLIEDSGTQDEFYGKHSNTYVYVLGNWGMARGMSGDFECGEGLCEKALAFAGEIDHRPTLGILPTIGMGYMFLGEAYTAAGRPKEPLEQLKKAEVLFKKMGMDYWLGKTQEVPPKL
jgi:hypothetical protein